MKRQGLTFTERTLSKAANAHEIAPYKTKCKDFEWRLALKTGDELDACDTSNVWYNVTILDERMNTTNQGKEYKELFIGNLRVLGEEVNNLKKDIECIQKMEIEQINMEENIPDGHQNMMNGLVLLILDLASILNNEGEIY